MGKSPREEQLWLGNAATELGEEYVSVVVQISPAIESGNRPCDAMEIRCVSCVMLKRRFSALGSAAIVENAVDHVTGAIDGSVDTLALPAKTYCVPASNCCTGTKIQAAPAGTASSWMAPPGPDSVACTVSNAGSPAFGLAHAIRLGPYHPFPRPAACCGDVGYSPYASCPQYRNVSPAPG